jgi:hypothetical protein
MLNARDLVETPEPIRQGRYQHVEAVTGYFANLVGEEARFKTLWVDKPVYRVIDNVKLTGKHICQGLTLVKYLDTYEVSNNNRKRYFKDTDYVMIDERIILASNFNSERPKYITGVEVLIFEVDGFSYGSSYPLTKVPFARERIAREKASNGPLRSKAKHILLESDGPAFIELGERITKTIVGNGIKGSVTINDVGVGLMDGDSIKVLHDGTKWVIVSIYRAVTQ